MDIISKIKFDYAKEYKEVKEILIDLGVIELAQKEPKKEEEARIRQVWLKKPDQLLLLK